MKLSKFLSPRSAAIEQKQSDVSYTSTGCANSIPQRRTSFVDYLLERGEFTLASYQALQYYAVCDSLYDGVDRIVGRAREIAPLVYNTAEKTFWTQDDPGNTDNNTQHPAIDLLNAPSLYTTSYGQFIENAIIFYLVTGNSYYVINSLGENTPPQMVDNIHPQNISPIIGTNNRIDYYSVFIEGAYYQYNKQITPDGRIEYVARLPTSYSKLYNIKKFNPRVYGFSSIGFSQLNPLYYRLEQTLAVARHNLSLLKRGTTLGGVFLCEGSMSDDNLQRFQAMIDEYFSGENSAGKPFVMDNAEGWTFTDSTKTSKDMDYSSLDESLTRAIYNNLKIPLPKISTDTMTLANMDASSVALYDDAILPILNIILENLTINLLYRYDPTGNLVLSYDKRTIPALEARNIDNMQKLKQMNVLTDNEIRESLNYSALDEGADDLYQPSSLLPYAR